MFYEFPAVTLLKSNRAQIQTLQGSECCIMYAMLPLHSAALYSLHSVSNWSH